MVDTWPTAVIWVAGFLALARIFGGPLISFGCKRCKREDE